MPNPHPTPYNLRKRSEQYTKEPVTLVVCSVSVESWRGLQQLAEGYREDRHKLPVTRFINRYITLFRIFAPPDFVLEAREQQAGKWKFDDFAASNGRLTRRLRLTAQARLHLEALSEAFEIPIRFSTAGGSNIGMSLELIGRGWITR